MELNQLLDLARQQSELIKFTDVMSVIETHYDYTPTRFTNGDTVNEAGTNEGSCKIFAFAQLNALSEMETLCLFGHYYHDDVLQHPDGDDHANIRNFILDGWLGIKFDGVALAKK